MRNVSKANVTQAVLGLCSPKTDPRTMEVVTSLVTHLHAFAKDVSLTHAEWRKGIELLVRAGEITDGERNEFVLFSDVLGLSSLVDMINSGEGGTESSVLGPFHVLGAPDLAYGGDLKRDNEGDTVFLSGQIRAVDGRPLVDARIELWQTAANGLYSNQDPAQEEYNFRARLLTNHEARYAVTTVRPAAYTVPGDGPVGNVLTATGRDTWRASHLHFVVQAPGYRTLVTEVFPADDPYLDKDAVFGVRESLISLYVRHDAPENPPIGFVRSTIDRAPFYTVDFDFILVKDEAILPAPAALGRVAVGERV